MQSKRFKILIIFLCLTIVAGLMSGCGSQKESAASSAFARAEDHFNSGQFQESKNALDAYLQAYPNGKETEKAKFLLVKVNNKLIEEKRKANRAEVANNAVARIGNTAVEPIIVDNLPGKNFITLAFYIPDITTDKMIIASEGFRKQSSGWGYIIYFVSDTDYKLANKRALAHKVLAVYASTTGLLEILDQFGRVKETINL